VPAFKHFQTDLAERRSSRRAMTVGLSFSPSINGVAPIGQLTGAISCGQCHLEAIGDTFDTVFYGDCEPWPYLFDQRSKSKQSEWRACCAS
jgi:hypothetical protein